MKELLNDKQTLRLLELLILGHGVDVNVSQLAKRFKHHRQTIKERLNTLYSSNIILKPTHDFTGLLKEMSLVVVSKDEFCRDTKTNNFIENDPRFFSAFLCKEEFYNTVTIQFHEDLYSYHTWCDNQYQNNLITRCDNQHFPEALLFSTKRIIKFDPSSPMTLMRDHEKSCKLYCMNDQEIDELSLNIIHTIMKGECIRTNETLLAKELGIQRKTVIRKIQSLLEANIISYPRVFFPEIFGPSDFLLIFSLIEIKNNMDQIIRHLVTDPFVPLVIRANEGRYNLFIIANFPKIDDFIEWQEEMSSLYPEDIGAMKNTFLSPHKSFSIRKNNVALAFIRNRLESIQ